MIGERLKLIRGGEAQEAFGSRFGITRNTVRRYESGTNPPDTDFISKLCESYNINAHWLITGKGEKYVNELETGEQTETYTSSSTDPAPARKQQPIPDMPSDSLGIAEGMTILGRIYGSGDQVVIRAINANLHAFNDALDNKAQAQRATEQLNIMESRLADLKKRFTALEQENKKLKFENQRLDTEEEDLSSKGEAA